MRSRPGPLAAAGRARAASRDAARRRLRDARRRARRRLGARAAAARRARRRRVDGAPAAARAVAARARALRRRRRRDGGRAPRRARRRPRSPPPLVSAAQCFRGEPVPSGPWRDYVTLTKPRIMSLLLLTGAAGMFVGAQGVPPLGALRRHDGRARARVRRRQRAQPRARRGHRPADGQADREAAGRGGPRAAARARSSSGSSLSALSFVLLASTVNVLTAMLALVGNLFYVARLHALAEALDAAEHRHRRRRRRGAAARRLRRRDREPRPAGALALPDRLPLDAAALLGARAADQGRTTRRAACRCSRSCAASAETTRQIVLYSLVLVAFTLVVGLWLGPVYTVAAAVLGGAFLALAWQLRRDTTAAAARRSSSTTPSPTWRCSSSRRPLDPVLL